MIRVEALGGLRILVNGEESAPLAKQRLKSALLVYLAVERSCMREALIGTFWPEREPERARHVLSQTVYELRKQLGEEWLTVAGDRLTVSDLVGSDVVEFTDAVEKGELESALGVYHGGFLDGTYLAESKEFEEWCDRRNQRLTKLLRRALKETCELPEVPAWIELAIDVARKSAERDPTDDEIQHALLQLLVRAGRRTDALRQYEKYEAALGADDLEPLDHTKQLIATIREATESVEPVVVTPFAGGNGPVVVAAPPRPVRPDSAGSPGRDRAAARKRSGAIAGGATIIALAVVLPFIIGDPGGSPELVKAAEGGGPRIAIMPFVDHSPPGEDVGYFAAGLTEGMIEALGKVRGIEVRSLAAVTYYSGLKLSPDSQARALDVDYVVNGSVSRSGTNLKARFEVTNAAGKRETGIETSHVWGDFLQMRDTLVADVAVMLRRYVGQGFELRERRAETRSIRALERYQQAKQIHEDFVSYMLANGIDEAERALNRADSLAQIAAREDSRWIAPVVLRARLAAQRVQVILYRGSRSPVAIRKALDDAIQHATRAIRIDPTAPEGHEVRGVLRYRLRQMRLFQDTVQLKKNDADAEKDLLEAVSIDSARTEAWSTLSELYLVQSRFLAGQKAAQHAYESDSYYAGANDNLYRLAILSFEVNDEHKAKNLCAEGRRRFPQHPQFVYCQLMLLAWGDSMPASVDSAWALARLSPTLAPPAPGEDMDAMFKLMVASVIARAENPDSARRVIDAARQTTSTSAAMLWMEAAARARLREFTRADSLVGEYNSRIGSPRSYVLDTRALKPLRDEHIRAGQAARR